LALGSWIATPMQEPSAWVTMMSPGSEEKAISEMPTVYLMRAPA